MSTATTTPGVAPTRSGPTTEQYLRGTAITSSVTQAILFLIVAGLAVSRAQDNVLSAAAVCGIVAAATASSAAMAWVGGLYGAGIDVRKLNMAVPEIDQPDLLAAPRLWRDAAVWALGGAAWAAAGGGLIAVALNGRVARFPVLLVALVGLAGVATLAVGNTARREGLLRAELPVAAPVSLRRRAWKEIALPLAVLQGVVNVGFGWLLFHDYATGRESGIELLTDTVALADAIVVVVILSMIFGPYVATWGAHDAATGRIRLDDPRTQSLTNAPRFGAQALVYVAILALVAFRLAALVLPATPSLAAVMVTRGLLTGALVGAACGVAYVRGACNQGLAGVKRTLALAAAALVGGMTLVPLAPGPGGAAGLDGLVTAEAESYALRVQYDVPLPFGPGTIPHTVGEIRRSQAGENSKGLAGAPTHFDAVVGGTYADPDKSRKGDERFAPQVECFYPGDLVNTRFGFPTDTQAETRSLPPTSRATARCGAGPEVELHAAAGIVEMAGITARGVASDTLARPNAGVGRADTAAHADGISIASGAVTIGSVDVEGASSVTGRAGEGRTATRVRITDVVAGGMRFSIADDRLIAGPQQVPLGSPTAQGVIDQANLGLAASRCRIDVVTQPSRYPQGFLFSRPNPRVGVDKDGSFAGSMRAGLLVLCDLPEAITGNTDLNPQRVQVVVGFAYTATSAVDEPGGFAIGHLVNSIDTPTLGATPALIQPLVPDVAAALPTPPAVAHPLPGKGIAPITSVVQPPRITPALDAAVRWTLAIVCLVLWAALTHLGIAKLRNASL